MVLGVLLVALLLGPVWGPRLPFPTFVGILAAVMLATGADVLFLNLNWACPRCGRYLGASPAGRARGRTIWRCPHCGYLV